MGWVFQALAPQIGDQESAKQVETYTTKGGDRWERENLF